MLLLSVVGIYADNPVTVKAGNPVVFNEASQALVVVDYSKTMVKDQTLDAYLKSRGEDFVRDWPQDQDKALEYFVVRFNKKNKKGMQIGRHLTDAVCGLSGVIHSYDLSPANVHDIHFLKDVKFQFYDCCILGDRAYLSAELQQDLFSSVGIKLEVPYRLNMKNWRPTFKPYAKARKRIETNFSQLCDHFMLFRNYAKQTPGLFTRIIGKISAFTVLQYINYVNNRPIGRVKYALN